MLKTFLLTFTMMNGAFATGTFTYDSTIQTHTLNNGKFFPVGITFAPKSNTTFVQNNRDNTIGVFDYNPSNTPPLTYKKLLLAPDSNYQLNGAGIAFDDNNHAFVLEGNNRSITVLDYNSSSQTLTLANPGNIPNSSLENKLITPSGIFFDQSYSHAFITQFFIEVEEDDVSLSRIFNQIDVFDYSSSPNPTFIWNKTITNTDIGNNTELTALNFPCTVLFNQDNTYAYVANYNAQKISILSYDATNVSFSYVSSIDLSSKNIYASGLTFSPDYKYLFITGGFIENNVTFSNIFAYLTPFSSKNSLDKFPPTLNPFTPNIQSAWYSPLWKKFLKNSGTQPYLGAYKAGYNKWIGNL